MSQPNFADVLMELVRRKRTQVVVGLDPRPARMPGELVGSSDGAEELTAHEAAEAFIAFGRAVVDAVAEHAVAVKCQVAFYERYGCEGMRAYADVLRYARRQGLITIGDVKRNDIAETAAAYADAHLGERGGDFVADAITINPYLGSDAVRPFLEAAAAAGRGVFALVKTSNPSSREIQDVDVGGVPLYEHVAALVEEWGQAYRGRSGYSALGAVVGATFPDELARLRHLMPNTPLLVPGFGAQGAGVADVTGAFDAAGAGAVVNSSRALIYAWERPPYKDRYGPHRWREAIRAAVADMRRELWDATH